MASVLKDLEEEISEKKLIAKILGGLSTKYTMLKTAWDSVDDVHQTTEKLQERLIKEERFLNDEKEKDAALAAVSSGTTTVKGIRYKALEVEN